ncbi:hypothetical protein [Seohaeicola saemankumensis]|uniref:hypothetical protein n=1 Tax=Seohaeicola saemankumensis TaxID=481181 RepID=UPI001E62EE50|nr:hypothetical protein [Seohaeicola saemankumensis]
MFEAKLVGKSQLNVHDFAKQFAAKKGIPKQYSPFSAPDFTEAFDPQRLFALNG